MSSIIGLLLSFGIAALFVLIAYHAARRFGRSGLLGAWIASSALLAFGMSARLRTREADLVFANNNSVAWTPRMFALLSLAAFGAAAVVTWRHYRRAGILTQRAVGSGIAAFYGGAVVVFVVLIIIDVVTFLRQ